MNNPKTVQIVPYLHERRIYLNRMKINTEYFYTTVKTKKSEEKLYEQIVNDKAPGLEAMMNSLASESESYASIVCINLMK